VCVTGVWAGVDSACEQKKLEARKWLKMATNPQRPVHAVLGAGLFRSLTIKLHHCLYAHCST
jgi:hypothetical protein